MGPALIKSTQQIYKFCSERFLPTPTKSHYLFNLREIAKVVQGLLMADPGSTDTEEGILRLWAHESERVFADRLTTTHDQERFREGVVTCLNDNFETDWDTLMSSLGDDAEVGPLFCDFTKESSGDGA